MERNYVHFLCDGSPALGMGHVMRCVAVANRMPEKWEAHFHLSSEYSNDTTLQFLVDEGFEVTLTTWAIRLAKQSGERVWVDSYQFNSKELSILCQTNTVLLVDDLADRTSLPCHALFNHNPAMKAHDYHGKVMVGTIHYLGTKYSMVSPQFATSRREFSPETLICLGGSDPKNQTLAVLQQLKASGYPFHQAGLHLVLGSQYQHLSSLKSWLAQETEAARVHIHQGLSQSDLVNVAKSCGTFITSASTIAMELASLGGLLYILQTAENQSRLYQGLLDENLAQPFEPLVFVESEREAAFRRMIKQQEQFGEQARSTWQKVWSQINQIHQAHLRPAEVDDAKILWQWANNPETRANSHNPDPILWDNHWSWYQQKLSQKETLFYLLIYKDAPVGTIRFDPLPHSNSMRLSYTVAPAFRGQSFGYSLVALGLRKLVSDYPTMQEVVAETKKDNFASRKVLERIGFMLQASTQASNSVISYILYS